MLYKHQMKINVAVIVKYRLIEVWWRMGQINIPDFQCLAHCLKPPAMDMLIFYRFAYMLSISMPQTVLPEHCTWRTNLDPVLLESFYTTSAILYSASRKTPLYFYDVTLYVNVNINVLPRKNRSTFDNAKAQMAINSDRRSEASVLRPWCWHQRSLRQMRKLIIDTCQPEIKCFQNTGIFTFDTNKALALTNKCRWQEMI